MYIGYREGVDEVIGTGCEVTVNQEVSELIRWLR